MTIRIGNAPCSWGVEFAGDPRNPAWREVLRQNAEAGYSGIELGPVGYMPEDPAILGEALAEHGLELIGGVVFRPYHDPAAWDDVLDATHRTARALQAHGVYVRLGFGYFFFTIGVGLIKFHEIPKGFDGAFCHALVVNAFVGLVLV